MDVLVIIWLLVWMLKTGTQDVLYAWSGKPNPRYELKKQRALAAGKAAPGAPRYGTRDWFSDLYSDALVAHTEKRRAKVKSGKQSVDDMLAVAKVRPTDQTTPARRPPAPAVDESDPAGVVHDDQHPYCTKPCGPNCGRYRWTCGQCGESEDNFISRFEAEQSREKHTCKPQSDQQSAPEPTPKPGAQAVPGPLATVIPMHRINPKESVMAINGEITGLSPAISYTRDLARLAGEHGTAGNEGYIGALTQAKVTGTALQTAHDMQAAFAAAQAAAEAHAKELAKQTGVQEQYDINPDAGDKQFMQQGR